MRKLSIHEDDEGLIQLEPLSNYDVYSDSKWDFENAQVYSPADETQPLSKFLSFVQVQNIVSSIFDPFDELLTGYGNHIEKINSAIAYGESKNCAIVIEYDKEQLLKSVWFLLGALSSLQQEKMSLFFAKVSSFGCFLLSDMAFGFQCRIDEVGILSKYLSEV